MVATFRVTLRGETLADFYALCKVCADHID